MNRRYFEATRPDGVVVKRSSMNRVYSHAVVIWHDATPPKLDATGKQIWPACEAGWVRSAEWASRLDLARKNASAWNAKDYGSGRCYHATVLEAREVTKPRRDHLTIVDPTAPPFGNR